MRFWRREKRALQPHELQAAREAAVRRWLGTEKLPRDKAMAWLIRHALDEHDRSLWTQHVRERDQSPPGPEGFEELHRMHDLIQARYWAHVRGENDSDPDMLAAEPAQEWQVVIAEGEDDRRKKEAELRQRWTSAGGKFYQARMIAHKQDRIWRRVSEFGQPLEPFEWGCYSRTLGIDCFEWEELSGF